jgi:hypothetical protein
MTAVVTQLEIEQEYLYTDREICEDKTNAGKFFLDKTGLVWLCIPFDGIVYLTNISEPDTVEVLIDFEFIREYRPIKELHLVVKN